MRVAAGQAEARPGGDETTVRANAATAARLTTRAAAEGARVLVLPEAFLTGHEPGAFAGPLPAPRDLSGPVGGWLAELQQAATDGDVVVVVSTALDRGTRRTLSSLVVRPGGEVVAAYDKQHLDGLERRHFVVGDAGASVEVDGVRLGLSICYDGCFPEHARAAAADGAQAYLTSAAWFPGGEHRRDLHVASRALENGVYAVLSGLTGRCGALRFTGGSAVVDPEGRVLARLGEEEGLAIADVDTDVVAQVQEAHPMLRDRRSDLGTRHLR
nr:carbon-nitrogen hydrolase family protein [Nocardioides perillae]